MSIHNGNGFSVVRLPVARSAPAHSTRVI
jgi:hypothetical protein